MTRTVIVSHSHPRLKGGGGEVAAHRQFEHVADRMAEFRLEGLSKPAAKICRRRRKFLLGVFDRPFP